MQDQKDRSSLAIIHAINVIISVLQEYIESRDSQLSFYKYTYPINKCPKIHIKFFF